MDTMANSTFKLLVTILCLFLNTHISLGADTISANQSLSGDQTIVSAGGVFVLGFFHSGNSSNYYIGMWYKQVTTQTVVWVANREKPVSDRFSSELRILNDNLVLFNESNSPIWSTNVNATMSSGSVQAVLMDNGNLVLKDESNNSKPLWQSFDYLTDTWLPGNKFGYNKLTKMKQVLFSWKNSEDPAPGLFSFQIDPSDASYVTLWNRSRIYWNTGPWTGRFTLAPEKRPNIILYFEIVSNDNETSFMMHATNSSVISFITMDLTGKMKQLMWRPETGWNVLRTFPRQQCQVYASCGSYGSCNDNSEPFCLCLEGFEPNSPKEWDLKHYSGGCSRKTELQCGNHSNFGSEERDKFLAISAMSLPENQLFVKAGSFAECESSCLTNCSCTAYAYNSSGCSIWTGDLLNLKQLGEDDSSGRTLYIRLAASELRSPKDNKGTIIGVVLGSVAGLVILIGLVLVLLLRRRKKTVGARIPVGGSLMAFGYRDLQNATKNFSEILGRGGFGSVFKGVLPDSTVIAVKRLEGVDQGEKQFRAEVSIIGTIQHVNLVRLLGFCSQGTKKLLVYDYLSNGSLASHLFDTEKLNILDWKTRYQIALGTAKGLAYLHENCRDCIIHCDIKPENILLDKEFCSKVADFGLAKLVGRDFSRILTTMRGTRGYLAPEWISGVAITSKADVYSYGMMLFEFVSGKRNSGLCELDGKVSYFPCLAASVIMKGGNVLSLLDPRLEEQATIEEIERVCRVACWCIQYDEVDRPSMSKVVQILGGVLEVELPPMPRSLELFNDDQENVMYFSEPSSSKSW
ncbi:G-type lectin S-receptor-like serine/threonine-protein kinase At2g19130 [Humulus lupulus]|uniref:G-type lectin S-receptor-like serine/threonine-protein kinase At2g19130 n=1 Tax=Humulus lupulus TaxID=3486 RepID=UPI002B4075F3|nr:G-type lectin S-receptor-like serine/threonine-protein kinase At2g19130 [Humulus lupulus]